MTFQSTQISNPFPGELSHSVFPVPQAKLDLYPLDRKMPIRLATSIATIF
jgi:hypothetical protein